jgi:hypothetical protein
VTWSSEDVQHLQPFGTAGDRDHETVGGVEVLVPNSPEGLPSIQRHVGIWAIDDLRATPVIKTVLLKGVKRGTAVLTYPTFLRLPRWPWRARTRGTATGAEQSGS